MAFKHPHCGGNHGTVNQARDCERGGTRPASIDRVLTQGTRLAEAVERAASAVSTMTRPRTAVTQEGIYRNPEGEVFKVYRTVHGANILCAKVMVRLDEPETVTRGSKTSTKIFDFEYVGSVARKFTTDRLAAEDRLTKEDGAEFGRLYGACIRCGLTLTKEESMGRGMGDWCAKKF